MGFLKESSDSDRIKQSTESLIELATLVFFLKKTIANFMIVSENKEDTAALEEGFLESLVKKPRLW